MVLSLSLSLSLSCFSLFLFLSSRSHFLSLPHTTQLTYPHSTRIDHQLQQNFVNLHGLGVEECQNLLDYHLNKAKLMGTDISPYAKVTLKWDAPILKVCASDLCFSKKTLKVVT